MNIHRQKPNDEIIIKYWWKLVNIHMRLFPSPECRRSFSYFKFTGREWSGWYVGRRFVPSWSLARGLFAFCTREDNAEGRNRVSSVVAADTFNGGAGQDRTGQDLVDSNSISTQWTKLQSTTCIYIYFAREKSCKTTRGRRRWMDGDWFNLMIMHCSNSRRWICVICILECVLLLIVIELPIFNPSSL